MKKVVVVGAGAQGGPCAAILAREKDVSEIVLADIDRDLAEKVKKKIASDKITTVKMDAGKVEDVESAAKGASVIINLTLTAFNSTIMQGALRCKAHYVDTSFGEPALLDIRARDNILSQIIEKRPLEFDVDFRDAGLTALVGCGKSPGVINVMARYVCDKLEKVHEIQIKLGNKSLKGTQGVVRGWAPNWSPFRALWGYAVEPTIFENGQYAKHALFDGPEEYRFPDPVGPVLLSYHQHQEPITLPHFIGKGIRYCDFKYPVDPAVGAFVRMGFGSPEPVDVGGVKVVPRDVLLNLVRHPVNAFLTEDEATARRPLEYGSYMAMVIRGVQSGEDLTYTVTYPFSYFDAEERLDVYRRFGANKVDVSLPAVVGARMCVEGEAERGVIAAECLDPVSFLRRMADMGSPVRFDEICHRRVSIS